jgi:hypothetical protein
MQLVFEHEGFRNTEPTQVIVTQLTSQSGTQSLSVQRAAPRDSSQVAVRGTAPSQIAPMQHPPVASRMPRSQVMQQQPASVSQSVLVALAGT